MTTTDLPPPPRVLAIGAHPDDIEFGAAATLAKWAQQGSSVHLAVLTDGSKGSWDPSADSNELVMLRRAEQQRAAELLGAQQVHFGPAVDGELRADHGVEAFVCETVRRVRPDIVLTHDPWRRHRIHPDHEQAGVVTVRGIVAARDPHFHPAQDLPPARPRTVLCFESDAVDHVEVVTGAHVAAKIEALLMHRSQWRSTMRIDRDPPRELERFRRRITVAARAAGARVGRAFGEAFLRVDGW